MEFSVLYQIGRSARFTTCFHAGVLRLTADAVEIEGAESLRISYRELTFPSEVYRVHFLCRAIRLIHRRGHLIFTVPLLRVGGIALVSHYPRVQELQRVLDQAFRTAWSPEGATMDLVTA